MNRLPWGGFVSCLARLAAGIVLTVCLVSAARAAEPVNLVANGDFAKLTNGRPDNWETSGDPASVTQELKAAKDADGKSYAQLVCTRCQKQGPSSHAMLAQVGAVNLVKGRMYQFSCRMRAEDLGSRTVSVAVSDTKTWANCGLQEQMTLTGAWKQYTRVFHASQDVGPTGRLQIWFNEPGTLCVADVRIVEFQAQDVEFTDVVPPAGGRNLVHNGSFEVGAAGWSSIGAGAGWGNLDKLHGSIQTDGGAAHGKSFLRIPVGGDRTPVLYFDYFEPIVRREFSPLAASRGWIKVEKGATYTLSCRMRASKDGVPAVLGVRGQDPLRGWRDDHQQKVHLTTAWSRYSLSLRPVHGYLFVVCGPAPGQEQVVDVDVDAVQLEKADSASEFQPRTPVEFALEPSQDAGVFVAGSPASLQVRLFNHGSAAAKVNVGFQVKDFDDKPAPLPDVSLEVAGGSSAQREVSLPPEWRGYYRVRATAEAGGESESADLRLAIVPPRTENDSVCGINHAFASGRLIDLAGKAGVTWYRDWSLKWQHLEPAKGEFHWEVGDAQIDRVIRRKVNLMALMPPFPSADWSSEAPARLTTKDYPGVRLRQAFAPRDPNDLGVYVEKVVGRYKDRVGVWEFLNEPIYTDYALPADAANRYNVRHYTPADYVALLQVAAGAMRKADPNCRIIAGIGSGPSHMTREVIEAGCLKHADILVLHIYPGPRAGETYTAEMDELLGLMDRHGGRKPIWITEFSYYAADDLPRRPFFPGPGSWSEARLLESEKDCADLTLRFYLVMLSHGAQKVFIHSGASGQVNNPNFECALFDYGGAPRKLFPAMAVMTELLGGRPQFVGKRRLGKFGHCVAFEAGKRSVLAMWCEDPGAGGRVTGPDDPEGVWVDAMGRKLTAPPAALSTSPVYLVGPAGKAKAWLEVLRSTN